MPIPPRLRTACAAFALAFRLFFGLALLLLTLPFATGLIDLPQVISSGGVTVDSELLNLDGIVDSYDVENGWTLAERAEAEAAIRAHFAGDRGAAARLTLVGVISFIPVFAWLLIARCLTMVAEGDAFDATCIRNLRHTGTLIALSAVLDPLVEALIRLQYAEAFQAWRPIPATFDFSMFDVLNPLFLAVVAWTAAWVLAEGRLRDEAEAFV